MTPPAWLPPDWPAPPGVHACVTLRHGAGSSPAPFDHFNLGAHCGDSPDAVRGNRAELQRIAGLPAPPRWLRQVHGIEVRRFVRESHDAPPSQAQAAQRLGQGHDIDADQALADHGIADASVTSDAGIVLAILTADCLPVLFCARDGSEIAAAHAGWRGLAAGVLEATVHAMRTPPGHLIAWFGPAAGPQDYEVGAEVRDAFVQQHANDDECFVATRPGHWHADLYALARRRLMRIGMASIHGGGLSTIADPHRFFSHRRDARTGRIATLIWKSDP